MQEEVKIFLMGLSAMDSPSPRNCQVFGTCSHVTLQSAHAWAEPAQMTPWSHLTALTGAQPETAGCSADLCWMVSPG